MLHIVHEKVYHGISSASCIGRIILRHQNLGDNFFCGLCVNFVQGHVDLCLALFISLLPRPLSIGAELVGLGPRTEAVIKWTIATNARILVLAWIGLY